MKTPCISKALVDRPPQNPVVYDNPMGSTGRFFWSWLGSLVCLWSAAGWMVGDALTCGALSVYSVPILPPTGCSRHVHRVLRKQAGLAQPSLLHFLLTSPRLQVGPASRGQGKDFCSSRKRMQSQTLKERRCRQVMTVCRQSITSARARNPQGLLLGWGIPSLLSVVYSCGKLSNVSLMLRGMAQLIKGNAVCS